MVKNKMKLYTIRLITGILLTVSTFPLIAQEDTSVLTLEKNGEQVFITMGEYVEVSSSDAPSNTVRGIYLGMTVDALRIQEKGESFVSKFPMDEIGSIFRGKTKSTKEYVWGGIKLGGLVSVGIGGIIYLQSSNAYWTGMFGLLSGFATVPVGALFGFIRAKVSEGKSVEYVIGDGEWVIVK